MPTTLHAPPAQAPYHPSKEALKLSTKEEAFSIAIIDSPNNEPPCSVPVEIGLFFDGTNNNMARDFDGQRVATRRALGADQRQLAPDPLGRGQRNADHV